MFEALVIVTAAIGIYSCHWAWKSSHDPFHPMLIAVPIAMFFNVWQPAALRLTNVLNDFLRPEHTLLLQTINALLLLAFCVGCRMGSGAYRQDLNTPPRPLPEQERVRLFASGMLLGILGTLIWTALVIKSGGLSAVYGTSYGGAGISDYGWLRDSWFLCFSGLILTAASARGGRLTWAHFALMLFIVMPHAVHAFLGARRGPTFVTACVLGMSWYMFRGRRPPAVAAAVVGICIGLVMLLLVENRGSIYVGSEEYFEMPSQSRILSPTDDASVMGLEYIAGGAEALTAYETGKYGLGTEWPTVLFLRPIPKELLPDKYELLEYRGPRVDDVFSVMRWDVPPGHAVTFINEMFREFSWFGSLACYVAGWLIGRSWRRAVERKGIMSTSVYILVAQGLLHLMAQDVKAWVVPFLIMGMPTWLIIRLVVRERDRSEQLSAMQSARAARLPIATLA